MKRKLSDQMKRKLSLVQVYGSKCSRCGYDRNLCSLVFHEDKDLNNKVKNTDGWIIPFIYTPLAKEMLKTNRPNPKVQLVCANCHGEIENPYLNLKEG